MALLVVLLLFILVYSPGNIFSKNPAPLAPFAIRAIIDEYYVKTEHEIQIISFGVRNGHADTVIEKLLKLGNQSMPVSIHKEAGGTRTHPFWLKNPSILLFDSPENFNQSLKKFYFRHSRDTKCPPYLIYVHEAKMRDITITRKSNSAIDKTVFLIRETRQSILLATAFLFTPVACQSNQYQVINQFTRQNNRWNNSNFFVEKYRNFYNCTLFINRLRENNYPFIYSIMAEALNFSMKDSNDRVKSLEKISFYFKPVNDLSPDRLNMFMIHSESRKILVPPGELYGDYEKMLLPFETITWIAIGLTISISVATIIVLKLRPKEIQRVIFGSNNSSPLMNFISIVLNGSQHTPLLETAPRICLAVFLIWSLIFR
jgi:hypothetical protein